VRRRVEFSTSTWVDRFFDKAPNLKINVYGLGYVGSVSAACLAADGHQVLGIDVDPKKVESINSGKSPVLEPGLPELIRETVESGRLRATVAGPADADVSLVCVGTPSNENGSLGLEYVSRAVEQIGEFIQSRDAYHVVCIRSTVLPGTTETMVAPLLERYSGKTAGRDFGLCMNPEFLREGSSIRDYRCPPFTIIGELDARSGDAIEQIYAGTPAPVVRAPLAVAEMVKYAGNAFHALKITFANELGLLCKRLGVDGTKVLEVFCRDEKLNISSAYLKPGFAFGGSCLPKDLRALLYKARELDLEPPVLRSILHSNSNHIEEAYRLIRRTGKKKIAMLGLSFKPGTDDLRESPIAQLIEMLIGKGLDVAVYDEDVSLAKVYGSNRAYIEQTIPHIARLMRSSLEDTISDADVIVIAKPSTGLQERLAQTDGRCLIIDLVRALPHQTAQSKLRYEGICW
jgi:GDP-mannose 6-dehydrogenase